MEPLAIMPIRVLITASLKKAILSGEYKGGQELSLVEVSKKLNVSRTPIREAFQILEKDGFLELRMNKGAIVKTVDEKFIQDHYETRILLECECVRQAIKHGINVELLLNEVHVLSQFSGEIDKSYFIRLNQQLHTDIWKAADNKKIYSILLDLWNGPSVGLYNSEQEHFVHSTQEHLKLLTFMQQGNATEAAAVMEEHIRHGMSNMMQSFRFATQS